MIDPSAHSDVVNILLALAGGGFLTVLLTQFGDWWKNRSRDKNDRIDEYREDLAVLKQDNVSLTAENRAQFKRIIDLESKNREQAEEILDLNKEVVRIKEELLLATKKP